MNTIRLCSSCAKPLPPDAPAGLCPVCLLKTDFGTEPVAENAPPSPAEIARHFPHLEILELIGRGGMGIVYKARQPKLDRLVALKILPVEIARDPAFAERFSREAKALARLNHPNIVTVYDFGQSGAYYYFIMEFVDGMNLRQLIRAKTLEPRQALELVTQICTALQFAHDEKIVHRDIKPENLLITKKGQVKIADFGLAKLLGSQPDTALTASQMVMGTMNYMAPEQRENTKDVDHRADIYSLGVVFYEMLTGEVPMGRFDAPSKKVQIDVRLDEVVLHALEREPSRRYQHVSEVKSNVESISSTMPKRQPAKPAPESIKPKPLLGFFQSVAKPFVVFAGIYLLICVIMHWMTGDLLITIDPKASFFAKVFLFCISGLAALFSLALAVFVLPVAFLFKTYTWLEAKAKRGLSLRQCPPEIQRRHRLWNNRFGVAWSGLVVATLIIFWSTGISNHLLDHKFRIASQQAMEYWFAPDTSNSEIEKLGLNLNFSTESEKGGSVNSSDAAHGSLPPGTVTLTIYRINETPAKMTVILPGLRAHYRIPLTSSWDYDVVLNPDDLANWLQKGAGLNPSAPGFKVAADEIYDLFKSYQTYPPETVPEFLNAAKASLRDFWQSGGKSDSFSVGLGAEFLLFLSTLALELLLLLVALFFTAKRTFVDAWTEIEAGRWTLPTPPAKPQPAATPSPSAPATPATAHPRLSRTAITGAACFILLVGVIAYSLVFQLYNVPFSHDETHVGVDAQGRDYTSTTHGASGSPTSWRIEVMVSVVLGTVGLLGMPICGWLAVMQIRPSSGTIYGLGLALFDGLFFPLLLLDCLVFPIVGLGFSALGHWLNGSPQPNQVYATSALTAFILTGLISVVLDFLIVRKVWLLCIGSQISPAPRADAKPAEENLIQSVPQPAATTSPSAPAPMPKATPSPAACTKKTVIFWLCAYGVFCLGWLVTKILWNFGSPGCWLACFGMAALVMCVLGIAVKWLRLFPAEFSLKKAMPKYLLPLAPIFLFLTLGFVFLIGGFFNQWEQGWWHGNLSAMTPQQFEAANKGKEYKLLWGLDAFVSNDVPIVEMNYGSVQRRQTGIADASIPFLGTFPGWESHGPRQDPDISLMDLPNGFFLLVWGPICLICGWRGPGTKPFRASWRNVLASLGVSACVLGSVLPIYIVCHLDDSYSSLGRSFRTKTKLDTAADTIQKWALQNGYAVGDEFEWDIQTVPKGNRVAKVSIREAWKPSPFDRWQSTWTSFHRVSPHIAFELVSTENPDQTIVNVSSVKTIPEDLISALDKIDQTNQ